jgi:large subunit ribosomal protein L24
MPSLDIKKGDTVYVLAGKSRAKRLSPEEVERVPASELKRVAERHSGRRGHVLRVIPSAGKVVVEGVNMMTKHQRARGGTRVAQMQRGRMEQPAPMPVCKVMLVCPRCDKPTRVQRQIHEGKRVRVCRRCNEIIDEIR